MVQEENSLQKHKSLRQTQNVMFAKKDKIRCKADIFAQCNLSSTTFKNNEPVFPVSHMATSLISYFFV